jgi:hypothetical protein
MRGSTSRETWRAGGVRQGQPRDAQMQALRHGNVAAVGTQTQRGQRIADGVEGARDQHCPVRPRADARRPAPAVKSRSIRILRRRCARPPLRVPAPVRRRGGRLGQEHFVRPLQRAAACSASPCRRARRPVRRADAADGSSPSAAASASTPATLCATSKIQVTPPTARAAAGPASAPRQSFDDVPCRGRRPAAAAPAPHRERRVGGLVPAHQGRVQFAARPSPCRRRDRRAVHGHVDDARSSGAACSGARYQRAAVRANTAAGAPSRPSPPARPP